LAAAYETNKIYWVIGVATAAITAFYMFRLYASTFLGKFRGTQEQKDHMHESPAAMTIPLVILAILAVTGGWIGIPEVFVKDGHWLQHFLAPVFAASAKLKPSPVSDHATEYMLMGISVAVALAATAMAVIRFSKKPDLQEAQGLSKILSNKWYVDELYAAIVVRPLNALSKFLDNVVEKSGIDWIVNGVGRGVQYGSRQLRLLQSGLVGNYVLLMIIGMLLLFVLQFFLKK
ncbi:MAG: NADH-quinone oxidoreductase subunit L, partial [Bacteroidota bacterium]